MKKLLVLCACFLAWSPLAARLQEKAGCVCHCEEKTSIRQMLHRMVEKMPFLDAIDEQIDSVKEVDPRDLVDQVFDAFEALKDKGIELAEDVPSLYEKVVEDLKEKGKAIQSEEEIGFRMLIQAKAAGEPYPSDEEIEEAIIAAGYHLNCDE